tara:strand:- start:539 stop:814 length:276 start_codon:yes stop_codon:yes gene_type:complete
MNLIKLILVLIVLCIVFKQIKPTIERFYPQVQGLPFKQENIDNNLYMCKDSNDLPYSCHGQGVIQEVYDKYGSYSGPCPKNWLIKGNSIYE